MADWSQIGGALLGGWFIPKAFVAVRRYAAGTGAAETRKTNAEADNVIINNLVAEVTRLSNEMRELRAQFAEAQQAATDEKAILLRENNALRGKVVSVERQLHDASDRAAILEVRVEGLVAIIKNGATPEDMKAQLDAIDGKTGAAK